MSETANSMLRLLRWGRWSERQAKANIMQQFWMFAKEGHGFDNDQVNAVHARSTTGSRDGKLVS